MGYALRGGGWPGGHGRDRMRAQARFHAQAHGSSLLLVQYQQHLLRAMAACGSHCHCSTRWWKHPQTIAEGEAGAEWVPRQAGGSRQSTEYLHDDGSDNKEEEEEELQEQDGEKDGP